MFIPLIPKNPDLNDFTCRDGEIDFIMLMGGGHADRQPEGLRAQDFTDIIEARTSINLSLIINHSSLEQTLRIPLQSGEKEKAELMLSGQISRVDPETADRLTQAIVQKAAECLLDLYTDLRRQGVFILPFRCYTMLMTPDGTLSYPSAQAIALPTDFPPHPEITAAAATDDTLTLAIRFPVSPHRLNVTPPDNLPEGYSPRTFISYPLYIPDPKEMRGSIGSVRSANGGQATGIRFSFLSKSAIKASVAAPEKYYELVGNERTGYRLSSKVAPAPDYSCYAATYGYVPPFPKESLLALGEGTDTDTDPLDWIADWVRQGEGYLPASLPYKYWSAGSSDPESAVWPDGIDEDFILETAEAIGASRILLTRPMTFATNEKSRRHAKPTAIRTLRVLGIPDGCNAHAILYGSDDGIRWTPLRRFDPRLPSLLLTPPRLFWRLVIIVMGGGHPDRQPVGLVASTARCADIPDTLS